MNSASYESADHHVARRDGLPDDLRPTILDITRDQWASHPHYAGHARFFRAIHRNLLRGASQLKQITETLVDMPEGDIVPAINKAGLVGFGNDLVSFAHHHHEIEDHGLFPQIGQLYPQLGRTLGLLDSDHQVLNAALDDAGATIGDLANGATPDRDLVARLNSDATALDQILNRHIWDEEEIIVPIFLEHG